MNGFRTWIGSLLLLAAGTVSAGRAEDLASAGPAYAEFKLTLAPGRRVEAGGPFYYREESESRRTWAVSPLLSYSQDPELNFEEFDCLFPLFTYDRYGDQFRWQFFQLFSVAGGRTQTESFRDRTTVFPLYFQQRSSDTNENYTAVGPFYGHLKHRLFHDEIFFVMFPFYATTRKGDVITDNYVYPFFHLRHGRGLDGWQFFPLVGSEHKEITTRTNRFNELETVPGHESQFVLWPIYHNDYKGIGGENPNHEQGVIPLFTYQRSKLRDATTVLWPFFSRIDDRDKNYREWQLPWPLVVTAHGPGKNGARVVPFYGHFSNTNLETRFVLWPIYKDEKIDSAPLKRDRMRVLFFLYSDVQEQNTETEASRRRVDFWPFFEHRREFNGNERLQVLALLEPFLPGSHKIPRDYGFFYSLWRNEKNPKTGATSQSLLWNLYRKDSTPARQKVSAFFGLYQRERGIGGRHTRWFYLPTGKGNADPQPATAPADPVKTR